MRQQATPQLSRPRNLFRIAWRALVSDATLSARAVAALAATGAAGAASGVVLALALREPTRLAVWLLAGAGVGMMAGLVLSAWLIADRRHPRRADRARRGSVAACIGLAGVAPGLALVWFTRTGVGGSAFAIVCAVLAAGLGVLALSVAERGALSRNAARRQAWLAQLRASRLTRRMLGLEAYRQLRRDGALPVKSTIYRGRVYLVPLRTTPSGARILVLEDDRPIGGLCLRPRQPLPDPEEALTHILAIRTDERAWLNRANFFPHDRHLSPQALGLAAGRPGNYDR